MGNIKLQKIVGNLLDKRPKILHEWNDYLEIFSHPQVIENSTHICFPNRYFMENSCWVPLNKFCIMRQRKM